MWEIALFYWGWGCVSALALYAIGRVLQRFQEEWERLDAVRREDRRRQEREQREWMANK